MASGGTPVRLAVNGVLYEAPDPTETLATFIRTRTPFTGCKVGCAEGGCGACAVLVSDAPAVAGGERRERTLNACLAPVGVLDGAAVLTSEGLKGISSSAKDGRGNGNAAACRSGVGGGEFHRVHSALAEHHASQCGFCTPGMAVACAAAARRRAREVRNGSSGGGSGDENVDVVDVDGDDEDCSGDADVSRDLDGNLCRCTGYRSIVDAARSLTPRDVEDLGAKLAPPPELAALAASSASNDKSSTVVISSGFAPLSPGTTWRSPRTLQEVREAVADALGQRKTVRFVAGNTGSGVYKTGELAWPPKRDTAVVSLQGVAELRRGIEVDDDDGSVVVSGGTTIAELADWCWEQSKKGGSSGSGGGAPAAAAAARSARTWREACRALRRVAGAHVRAAATVGGNLALAASSRGFALESDVATLLSALGAEATVVETAAEAAAKKETTLSVLDLVSASPPALDLTPTSLVVSVRIPPVSSKGSEENAKKKRERFFATRVAARYSHAVASFQLACSALEDPETGALSDVVVVAAFHRRGNGSGAPSRGRWRATRLSDAEAALEGAPTSSSSSSSSTSSSSSSSPSKGLAALAAALRAARNAALDDAAAADREEDEEQQGSNKQQQQQQRHAEFIAGVAEGALAQAFAPLFARAGDSTSPSPSSLLASALASARRLPTPQPIRASRTWPEPDPATAPVGASVQKDRAELQASGEALYTSDFSLPGNGNNGLHGALVLSSRPLATLASVDASRAARSVPGFVRLVTAADVPGSNDASLLGDRIFAPVGGRVQYVGERVGVVVAETEAAARAAAKLVDVVYEEEKDPSIKPILSIADAVRANSFYDVSADIGPTDRLFGDPDAAFAAAPHVLRGARMSMPSQAHLYMETQAAVALPDEGMKSVVVVSGTQCVDMVQSAVCSALGLPANKVNVRARRLGGGFGGKSSRSQVAAACAAVAAFAPGPGCGRPVKLVLSRAEDLATIGGRCELEAEYDVAFDSDGRILALDARVVLLGGAGKEISAFIPLLMLTTIDQNFAIPASRLSARLARTNLPPRTIMRAPGTLQATLLIEHVMDAVAASLGLDPIAVRELNLLRASSSGDTAAGPRRPCAGELPDGVSDLGDEAAKKKKKQGETSPTTSTTSTTFDGVVTDEKVVSAFGADLPLDQYTVPRLWSELKTAADVDARRRAVAEHNERNLFVKRGLAMAACRFVMSVDAKPAIVSIHHDGTVHVTSAGHEMGQGIHTKVLQAACLALSQAQPPGTPPLPMSLFHHADSSTDALPNCGPSWGSTTSEAASEAVRQAATKLADALRDKFVVEVEVDEDGGVAEGEGEGEGEKKKKPRKIKKTLTWKEVIASVHPSVGFSASKIPLTAYSFYDGTERHEAGRGKNALSYNGYGCAVTEAEVDALTGECRVVRADIILDAGASLNPALDSGQIEGGYVQGLGLALSEAVRVDPRTGACATSTWDYKVPTADACPRDLRVHLLEKAKHARGVMSSKAVGEPPLLLASTALCAVQAACDAAREGFAKIVGGDASSSASASSSSPPLLPPASTNGTIENRRGGASGEGAAAPSAPRTLLTAPATPAAVKAAIGMLPLAELIGGGLAGKL